MAEKKTNPYRNFKFRVEIQGIQTASFTSASVPDESMDAIEYREGTDPNVRKLSGMPKVGSLTLKKGVTSSMELYNWWTLVRSLGSDAPGARRHLSLVLVDLEGNDAARWNLLNAWPSKYEASELDAKGNDVQIETMEIAVESMTRAK